MNDNTKYALIIIGIILIASIAINLFDIGYDFLSPTSSGILWVISGISFVLGGSIILSPIIVNTYKNKTGGAEESESKTLDKYNNYDEIIDHEIINTPYRASLDDMLKLFQNDSRINEIKSIYKNRWRIPYKAPISNEQIWQVISRGSVSDKARLVTLILKHISKCNNAINMVSNLLKQRKSDHEYYKEIMKIREKCGYNDSADNIYVGKGKKTAERFYYKSLYAAPDIKKTKKYLDISCGDCNTTHYLGDLLGISKENIHGIDFKKWGQYTDKNRNTDITMKYYIQSEGKLPYKDNEFDLISTFMVLHHIPNLDNTLSEISRILSKGGYFMIREHGSFTPINYMINDIEHGLYYHSNNEGEAFHKEPKEFQFTRYLHTWECIYLFKKYGFEPVFNNADYTGITNEMMPTNYRFGLFRKI